MKNPVAPISEAHSEYVRNVSFTALLVTLALSVFVIIPVFESYPLWMARLASAVEAAILAVISTLLTGRHRAAIAMIVTTATLGIWATVLDIDQPTTSRLYLFRAASMVVLMVLASIVGRAVFTGGRVTVHRIQGAVAIYLMIGLAFMHFYAIAAVRNPEAFSFAAGHSGAVQRGRFLYFSFVTLTSTGYGDIFPVDSLARTGATLEGLIGQLFGVTMLGRVVTLEMNTRR